ncbi:MAG: endolytic transglycosylase MltG [Nocardioidaceae bacterium]
MSERSTESDTDRDPESNPGLLGQSHHRSHPRRLRGCLAVLVALVIVVGGLFFAVTKGMDFLHSALSSPKDYTGSGSGSVVVQVHSGDNLSVVGQRLFDAGVVGSVSAFTTAAGTQTVQPGYYQMHHQMSAKSALTYLVDGKHLVQTMLTIPEGQTADQIVEAIVAKTKISKASLTSALTHPGSLGLPSYAAGQVEGYLFPATYAIPPHATAQSVLTMMVDRYNQEATTFGLSAKAKALGVSPKQLLTVASLVQAEARLPQDFGKVARVIYNRDKVSMPLQFDSTIHYITKKRGEVYTTDQERKIDSPYNTYLYPGLPPGPIDNPGEQALKAAASPTTGSWLYFVTVNIKTGKTLFENTAGQHNRDVAELTTYCVASPLC